jgi:hypothetical protein
VVGFGQDLAAAAAGFGLAEEAEAAYFPHPVTGVLA